MVDQISIKGIQGSSLSVFFLSVKMPYADLQKRRDNVRRWKKANPDKVKAQKQRYRTRRAQSPQPPPPPPPLSQRRYNLRHRKVKRPEKIQLMNLVVVLKDYRKKDTLQCRRKVDKRQKNRLYYQRNRDRLLLLRKEYRQRNLEKIRVRKKSYCQRNREKIQVWRREYRQRNLDSVRAAERRYRQRNLEKVRERQRNAMRRIRAGIQRGVQRVEIREKEQVLEKKIDCECGLCFVCGGFMTASWSSKFDHLFERPEVDLEDLDRRCRSESDTSSLVDPQLVEELERMLNEPSECSDLSGDEEEDELEERLIALRTHREQGIQRRLDRWEKERELEESIECLAGDLGAVNEQLRDMERACAQFRREDTVTQVREFEYLHTVTITSDLMSQLEQNLL